MSAELVAAWFEGPLDPAQRERLLAWLRADPDHARHFMRAAIDHRALCLAVRGRGERQANGFDTRRIQRLQRPRRPLRARRQRSARGSRSRLTRWGLAAAGAVAAVVLLLAWPQGRETSAAAGPVLQAEPGARVRIDGRSLAQDHRARVGERIAVDHGTALLRFADGTRLRIEAGSQLGIAALEPAARLELERGALDATVSPRPAPQRLLLATPHGLATVLGTRLRLRSGPDASLLAVDEGRVAWQRSDGERIEVGAGHYAIAAAGVPFAPRPSPPRSQLSALPAGAFADSVGVTLFLGSPHTPYGDLDGLVLPALRRLGLRHVRDAAPPQADFLDRLRRVHAAGVGVTWTASDGQVPPPLMVETAKDLGPVLEAIEGMNEFVLRNAQLHDADGTSVAARVPRLRRYAQELRAALERDPQTASIPLIGPSVIDADSARAYGDLSAWADLANCHTPLLDGPPEPALATRLAWLEQVYPGLPVIVTGTGYDTADSAAGEADQAVYLPRLWFDALRQGVARSYLFDLVDRGDRSLGLLRADGGHKPAAEVLERLMNLLGPPGDGTAGDLACRLSGGDEALLHCLLQRSDGAWILAYWLALPARSDRVQTLHLVTERPLRRAQIHDPLRTAAPLAVLDQPPGLVLEARARLQLAVLETLP